MNIDAIPMGAEILAFKEIKADSNNNLSDFLIFILILGFILVTFMLIQEMESEKEYGIS